MTSNVEFVSSPMEVSPSLLRTIVLCLAEKAIERLRFFCAVDFFFSMRVLSVIYVNVVGVNRIVCACVPVTNFYQTL